MEEGGRDPRPAAEVEGEVGSPERVADEEAPGGGPERGVEQA
jgi:hypothetical protein